jgi:hypothetical protein
MLGTFQAYIVYQFIPLVFCAVFGIGLILLGYSFALPAA